MLERPEASLAKRAAAIIALTVGSAATFVAATSTIAWGMVLGSGVDLGGPLGARWLMNVTEGLVAVGVLAGGVLADRGQARHVAVAGIVALGIGALVGWRGHESGPAVLVGLGGLASFGAGLLMAVAVVVPATRARAMPGLVLGVAFCVGLLAVELIWGSGSMMALSRGAAWVIGHVAWIGPLAGAVGTALFLLADRIAPPGATARPRRLPFVGAGPAEEGARATETVAFWTLVALALLASFVGLAAQRAGAALSMIGVPENSFVSGVLVGFTFAIARSGGALAGGLTHDLFGPRVAVALTGVALATTQVVLSRFSGYDNPWHPLIGSVGAACGLGLTVVPIAAVFLLGRAHLGYHFGFLYLAVAFGNVMALPLRPTFEAHPQTALLVTAGLCLAVAIAGALLRGPTAAPTTAAARRGRTD